VKERWGKRLGSEKVSGGKNNDLYDFLVFVDEELALLIELWKR